MSKEKLYPSQIDVSVLLIFFTRPDTFEKVFEKVKEARPSKLFLACDGARSGEDERKIELCKQIAEDIDWNCEVYKNYAEKNMGCGMRPQTAITWAFQFTESLIILEDDCVPHNSFFRYMEEMIERYKNDERIGVLSGFNHFENWDCGDYSYFFTKNGPLAGAWATWKRVWDSYSYSVEEIKDPLVKRLIRNNINFKRAKKQKIKLWEKTNLRIQKNEKISYWDIQFSFLKYYQSYLAVVPEFSIASNIGLGEGSTHAVNAKNIMPTVFFAPNKNLQFPLRHPPFVICDHDYDKLLDKRWVCPNPVVKNIKRCFRVINRLLGNYLLVKKVNKDHS